MARELARRADDLRQLDVAVWVGGVETQLRAVASPASPKSLVPGDLVTPREKDSALCWSSFVICSAPSDSREPGMVAYARAPGQIVTINRCGQLESWDCWRAPCTG